MSYKDETLRLAKERSLLIAEAFVKEVQRLLDSGAVDAVYHRRGLLFGVALENLADGFLARERSGKEYKNLKLF